MTRLWTADEYQKLRECYPDYKAAKSALPGRTIEAIKRRACSLKLTKERRGPPISALTLKIEALWHSVCSAADIADEFDISVQGVHRRWRTAKSYGRLPNRPRANQASSLVKPSGGRNISEKTKAIEAAWGTDRNVNDIAEEHDSTPNEIYHIWHNAKMMGRLPRKDRVKRLLPSRHNIPLIERQWYSPETAREIAQRHGCKRYIVQAIWSRAKAAGRLPKDRRNQIFDNPRRGPAQAARTTLRSPHSATPLRL